MPEILDRLKAIVGISSKMEKKIVVPSNSIEDPGFENSLTKFRMVIPKDYLDPSKKWQVGVKKVGIHLQLRNPICSSKNIYPELIQMTAEDFDRAKELDPQESNEILIPSELKLRLFPESSKVFIDGTKSYSPRILTREIQKCFLLKAKMYPETWNGVPVDIDPLTETIFFGHFLFEDKLLDYTEGAERNKKRTIVMLHENFKKVLNFTSESESFLRTLKIDDQQYYYYYSSELHTKGVYPLKTTCSQFNIEKPRLIRVMSPNVEERIVNSDFYQILKEFACEDSGVNKYFQKRFDNIEYQGIKSISSVEINFVDENFEQLKLLRGLVSYVELSCKEMTNGMIPISISSKKEISTPNNNPGNFKIILPRSLDFSHKKNARVALTSISMSNYFEVLPGAQMNFMVMDPKTLKFEFHQFPKDGSINTHQDIQKWFHTLGKDVFDVVQRRTNVYKFKKPVCLAIGRDLAEVLGMPNGNSSRHGNRSYALNSIHLDKDIGAIENYYFRASGMDEDDLIWKRKIELLVYNFLTEQNSNSTSVKSFMKMGHFSISAMEDTAYICTHPSRMIKLFPSTLYVYADFIDHSVISGEYRQLLKVVSLPLNSGHDFTIEYENPEYVMLNHSVIQQLEFNIMTHDDRNIKQLYDDSVIYMTLNFQND